MSIFSFNLSGFGLDITDRNLKLVQAVPVQSKYRLQAWGEIRLKPGIIVHGEIIDKAQVLAAAKKLKDSLQGRLTSELAIVSLPETKTFLKFFRIEKPEEADKEKNPLLSGIELELPKQIPLPVENIIYDYSLVGESKLYWDVLVGAAPRDIVLEYTDLIKAMGFTPLAMEIEAQAICRALLPDKKMRQVNKINDSSKDSVFGFNLLNKKHKQLAGSKASEAEAKAAASSATIIADLGASRSSMIVYDRTIRFTRTLELSGTQLTDEISSKLKLTPAKAEQAKVVCGLDERKCKGQVAPIMKGWVSELVKELQSTTQYYVSLAGLQENTVQQVLLCGGSASLAGLPEILSEQLGVPVRPGNPWLKFVVAGKKITLIPPRSLAGFTTAIGLAIR